MLPHVEELGLTDGLVQLSFAVQAELVRVAKVYGATLVQMRLIGIVRDREVGMAELAGAMGITRATATGLVQRAEARGHVRRSGSDADGRSVRVNVTDAGRDLAAAVAAEVAEALAALTLDLDDDDRVELARLATAVVARGPQLPA